MLTRAIAVTFGIALAAAPGTAQSGHQHDHAQDQGSPDMTSMMMHEMMATCPFMESSGMDGGMTGMMDGGMTGMMDGGMMGTGNTGMMSHGMMSGMGGQVPGTMGGGMMRMQLPCPHRLIGMKDELNLSEAQLANLETLAGRASKAVENHVEGAMAARVRANEILSGNVGGFDEYGEALRAAATHMVEAHIAMARSGFEAQSLLSPEQKKSVSPAPTGMRGMHEGGMMGGGMTGGFGGHGSG